MNSWSKEETALYIDYQPKGDTTSYGTELITPMWDCY